MNKLTRLKRCKRCISTLMLMCCSLLVWAQNTVTGTVLDESNLEVIGANGVARRVGIGTHFQAGVLAVVPYDMELQPSPT